MRDILVTSAAEAHQDGVGRGPQRVGMPAFVACLAGVARSSTLVLAHLLASRFREEGLESALEFLTARRPLVRPNPEQIEAARLAAFAFHDRG